MCDVERNTDYFTERLIAEKEADLIRLAKINEALREVNAMLVEENRKLKEGATMADLIDCRLPSEEKKHDN